MFRKQHYRKGIGYIEFTASWLNKKSVSTKSNVVNGTADCIVV